MKPKSVKGVVELCCPWKWQINISCESRFLSAIYGLIWATVPGKASPICQWDIPEKTSCVRFTKWNKSFVLHVFFPLFWMRQFCPGITSQCSNPSQTFPIISAASCPPNHFPQDFCNLGWETKPGALKKGPYSRLLTTLKNAAGCCRDHPDWSTLSMGAAEKDASGERRLTKCCTAI